MLEFELRCVAQKSGDLPGYMFIRLEFYDRWTNKQLHIMENHVKPRAVVRWIAAQIKFVRAH